LIQRGRQELFVGAGAENLRQQIYGATSSHQ